MLCVPELIKYEIHRLMVGRVALSPVRAAEKQRLKILERHAALCDARLPTDSEVWKLRRHERRRKHTRKELEAQ
jgi:hypothetical protein